ncbi:glycosyl hydrolase [bacterium]|nr:glycosyl hydrolase [bacterium]
MKRKLNRYLILLALSVLLTMLFISKSENAREENGPFPSDWFMSQRIWPDTELPSQLVLDAARQSASLRNSALDEDPHWIPEGPTNIGGRITDIVADPANDQIIYVAAASGGIFKTTDGGMTWNAIFDGAPTLSVGALAMDPQNSNILYAGTGEANSAGFSYFGSGVYKSANAGQSWTHIGLDESRYIGRIAVHPEDPSIVWVAAMGELFNTTGDRGLYLSEDGGATWERKLYVNDTTGCVDVVVDPNNTDVVYAAMWQRIRNPIERRAGGRGSGIYKSTNRGETWTRLNSGLPPVADDVGRIGLAIAQSNPQVLYAIYADHPGYFAGIFRTADSGENWSRVNDDDLQDMYSSFGWYFGNIRVRPDDENVVFALGVYIWRSTNGGQTWTANGAPHVDHHALWFNPATPFHFLNGNDGGLYRSTNNGNSYTFIPGLPINQFYAATADYQHPERLYGGTQDNGTMRTITGANDEYESIYWGDGFYVLVDPTNNNNIYAEYQYGNLARSTDGGQSFQEALVGIDESERRNWSTPVAMAPSSPNTLYFGAERVYRTINRAQDWSVISPNLTNGPGGGNLVFGTITTIGVSPANPQVIWAGTDDANVWVTTNSGSQWSLRNSGLPQRNITRITPHPANASEALVTISGFQRGEQPAHLFYTTDFGLTWTSLGEELPNAPLNDALFDSEFPSRIYVASDFGVFWSRDYGDTWSALGQDMPAVPLIDLVMHQPSRKLVAATYGRSFLSLDLDSLIANHPPVIHSITPESPHRTAPNTDVLLSVDASDPDGDDMIIVWRLNGEVIGTSTPINIQFPDTGTYVCQLDVADQEFQVSDSVVMIVQTSDARETPLVVTDFSLCAYPNPFNSSATLRFDLPSPSSVVYSLFTVDGRQIETRNAGYFSSGSHRLNLSAKNLPSGVIFLRLQAGRMYQDIKLLLIK